MKTRFPLSVTDELFLHLEEADEPMSLQLDLRFSGRLDEQALELALFSAMKVHPLTSVRMHRRNGTEGGYEWEAVDRPDEDPVLAMDCGTDDAVETARNDFYSRRLSLESAPPFRCLIARHDGGDWLFLKMSHAVTDAPGSYRFLQSVLRRYAGISDSQPEDMDLINARDLGRQYGAKSVAERIQRGTSLLGYLMASVQLPTRIAPHFGEEKAGVAFVSHTFSKAETDELAVLRKGSATLNDVLATLLHLTIQRWNEQRRDSASRITLMNAVSLRPVSWREEGVGNLSLWVNVATTGTERFSYERALASVAEQTRKIKAQETAGLLVDLLNMTHLLPTPLRKALTRLMPLTGHFVVDTAVLNNLGRVPDLPDPAGKTGRLTAIRFSPPTHMPMGVAVGAVTLRGELTLTFRYRLAQFDRHAANAFRDLFVTLTRELVAAGGRQPA
ncbi:MAG: hypothetical protein ACLGHE_03290 [Gammaproteobacteria bacterium]